MGGKRVNECPPPNSIAVHKAGENGSGKIDVGYPGLVGFYANQLPSREFFVALRLTHLAPIGFGGIGRCRIPV